MNEVNVSRNEDLGGWFAIEIFAVDEILNCPLVLTNKNASKVEFISPEEQLDFLPLGENIVIRESQKRGKNGFTYAIDAEFEISVQSKLVDDYFHAYLNKKVVIIGVQHSGLKRMYGSEKFPLTFDYRHINGTKAEDGQRMQVMVSGEVPQKPVYVDKTGDENSTPLNYGLESELPLVL